MTILNCFIARSRRLDKGEFFMIQSDQCSHILLHAAPPLGRIGLFFLRLFRDPCRTGLMLMNSLLFLLLCRVQCFRTRVCRQNSFDWQESRYQGDGSLSSTTEGAHRQRDPRHEGVATPEHRQLPGIISGEEQRALGSHGIHGRWCLDGYH